MMRFLLLKVEVTRGYTRMLPGLWSYLGSIYNKFAG